MFSRTLRPLSCVLLAAAAVSWMAHSATAQDDDSGPTRIVIVLRSTDEIVADLKHMIVDLAGQEEKWDNSVYPNIDIFLYGIDTAKPIRFDQLIDGEGAQRPQMVIPLSNLNTFIDENLDPIGIIVKQDKNDDSLYKLSDVYEGWMRVESDYSAFAEKDFLSDIPENFDDLIEKHDPLLEKGYDIAVLVDNSATSVERRRDGFKTFQENVLAGVKKRPDETREAYELRYANSENTIETLERIYVESTSITIGWTTDAEKSEGRGELLLVPVADTNLAKAIATQAQEPSFFHSVTSADNAVLSGRLNFTLSDMLKGQMTEINKLSRPVAHQKIDEKEGPTDGQKDAQKQISDLLFDLFDGAAEMGVWDGLFEITPQDSGLHTAVFAVRTADGTQAAAIVELLPQSSDGYGAELNVDKAADVDIHKITLGDRYPNAFKEFFGEADDVYVGTSTDAVWLSMGDGALDAMKAGVEKVAEEGEAEADRTIGRLDLHLLPILKVMYQLRQDGDFDLTKTLNQAGEDSSAATDGEEEEESETAQMLKDFQWREAAIKALAGENDELHMLLERTEDGNVTGETKAASGILKAIGELIAQFADDNFG